ncbi:SMP-30/gluconolactonase/LRE family protein [Synechococcales cyanobacterium C]|uniref:SMP-30/gluconolactonase/LRE family protein n=1 Tax=Petrachloros mirabilis ULC683 TaxID=2781853 RepID=A0A8K1ZZY5_9CYAN|nr:SMP-30/gluconolactonase/LRE family protein [Petrachloros mirabilis]NCJ07212.1 SMP-30/gluconolactonase/LRE family protein [Petrachloros mirabilis ULC683]
MEFAARLMAQNRLIARARLGEGPLWDGVQQVLYWVDIYNHRVHIFDPDTGQDCHWDVGDVVSALALMADDRLLMAMGNRLATLNLTSGVVETLRGVDFPQASTRFNDGKCDPQGRFWIGSLAEEPGQAALYRYDPDGALQVMETGLTISNGLGWSPDGDIFYLTDSSARTIYAYRFEGETGQISDRTPLIQFTDEQIEPDGLTIDQDGNLWVALWDGWCLACISPRGEELGRVQVPVPRPTCPTFGGPNLRDLYVTSASVGLSQKAIQQAFEAGDLFGITLPVRGIPTTPFGSP